MLPPLHPLDPQTIYQRLVDKMFGDLRGSTVEAYVDDMVIKSKTPEEHPGDLAKVFSIFNKYKMKLNPEKCIFCGKGSEVLGTHSFREGYRSKSGKN